MKKKGKFAGKTRTEIVEMLKPDEKKYSNTAEHIIDLNQRLEMAIEEGADPLGYMTIKEIYEDIKFLSKLKNKKLE